jgi:hypothetical protein
MASDLPLFSPSESRSSLNLRRWRSFLRSNGALRMGFFTTFLFTGLIVYLTFFPHGPSWRLPDWHPPLHFDPDSLELANPNETLLVDPKFATLLPSPTPESTISDTPPPPSPSSSPVSDVLTLEQIRDIVAPTRGFFSRDYSLGLGWNNVSGVC